MKTLAISALIATNAVFVALEILGYFPDLWHTVAIYTSTFLSGFTAALGSYKGRSTGPEKSDRVSIK